MSYPAASTYAIIGTASHRNPQYIVSSHSSAELYRRWYFAGREQLQGLQSKYPPVAAYQGLVNREFDSADHHYKKADEPEFYYEGPDTADPHQAKPKLITSPLTRKGVVRSYGAYPSASTSNVSKTRRACANLYSYLKIFMKFLIFFAITVKLPVP